jgi:gluconokinase
VLVGVDLGTSSAKVLACTLEGRIVAQAAASYPLATPRPEWVEQDADTVYRASMHALAEVLAQVRLRGDDVAAIGFSSAMHGVLPVDARGEPAGPLVTWMDRRSAPVAERWRADGTADEVYRLTGAPVHPMLPSCKLRWLSENDPVKFQSAARFVSMKELLIYRWTGEWLVDWGIASATGLFDMRKRDWSDRALEFAGVDRARLSQPVRPSTTRRNLREPVVHALGIERNAAIVIASSDGALANLGVGAIATGEPALTLGTSGAVRIVVEEPILDERGRTFCYCYDDLGYIVGGPTSSAGAVLNKIHELLLPEVPVDERFGRAVALAEKVEPGASGLTVLPFLSGERAPYWRAELRGAIVGLDLSHSRADIVRAAFESVIFALAAVMDVLRPRVGSFQRMRLSGGLTHAPLVRQLVADIFACEAVLADQEEASAFGAAVMAGLAIGALHNASVNDLLHPVAVHEPDPALVSRYQEIFGHYRQVVDTMLPVLDAGALGAD